MFLTHPDTSKHVRWAGTARATRQVHGARDRERVQSGRKRLSRPLAALVATAAAQPQPQLARASANRPRTQARWLQRGQLEVQARHHTGHRVRARSRPACGQQLQHRVVHRRESSEVTRQPAGSICSAAGSARLTQTRLLALASTQRSTSEENDRVPCSSILLGESHAVVQPKRIYHSKNKPSMSKSQNSGV